VRFGTFYFFQAAPGLSHAEVVHRELEQMEWTEELGFDEIWLTEHHFIDYGLAVDPASLAASAAARTRRVRIGLAAAILPFHHPLRLAEQLSLIDITPRGAWTWPGRGATDPRSLALRRAAAGEPGAFDEAADIILKAWTSDRFEHRGGSSPSRDPGDPCRWRGPRPIHQVWRQRRRHRQLAARGWPMRTRSCRPGRAARAPARQLPRRIAAPWAQ
jgi:alkanesulfonate monooxygenase SsuD/methylene tetrahydromethanopterin reductase-like flavin-dependent oxidoreductase (luciferase family)